jgi:hypothetical protein
LHISQFLKRQGIPKKAIVVILMLSVWKIWSERNARVFHNVSSPPAVILANIKIEAQLWVRAGAAYLGVNPKRVIFLFGFSLVL